MKRNTYLLLALSFLGVVSCTDEDYKLYDTSQKDSVFFDYVTEDGESAVSINYAFNYDIANSHTIAIPVKLMGMPTDHDRQISLKAVGETTMEEGVHYTIERAVIPANQVSTTVKVELLRDNDPELQQKEFSLMLQIQENEDLRSVGQKDFTITYSDIRPENRPSWWSTWSPLPTYSFESAQIFFKYFNEKAPVANQSVYDEMIERYGEYFVNAVSMQGPLSMYRTFLIKYVLIPMYDDYGDELDWQDIPTL